MKKAKRARRAAKLKAMEPSKTANATSVEQTQVQLTLEGQGCPRTGKHFLLDKTAYMPGAQQQGVPLGFVPGLLCRLTARTWSTSPCQKMTAFSCHTVPTALWYMTATYPCHRAQVMTRKAPRCMTGAHGPLCHATLVCHRPAQSNRLHVSGRTAARPHAQSALQLTPCIRTSSRTTVAVQAALPAVLQTAAVNTPTLTMTSRAYQCQAALRISCQPLALNRPASS